PMRRHSTMSEPIPTISMCWRPLKTPRRKPPHPGPLSPRGARGTIEPSPPRGQGVRPIILLILANRDRRCKIRSFTPLLCPRRERMPTVVDLLADLTDAQQEAVTHFEGPLLILAGA